MLVPDIGYGELLDVLRWLACAVDVYSNAHEATAHILGG
jgi:hypothetical protein